MSTQYIKALFETIISSGDRLSNIPLDYLILKLQDHASSLPEGDMSYNEDDIGNKLRLLRAAAVFVKECAAVKADTEQKGLSS